MTEICRYRYKLRFLKEEKGTDRKGRPFTSRLIDLPNGAGKIVATASGKGVWVVANKTITKRNGEKKKLEFNFCLSLEDMINPRRIDVTSRRTHELRKCIEFQMDKGIHWSETWGSKKMRKYNVKKRSCYKCNNYRSAYEQLDNESQYSPQI